MDRYGDADLHTLQDVADAIAPALERIRIEESLGRSRELLRLERDVALLLGSTNDLNTAMRESSKSVSRSEESTAAGSMPFPRQPGIWIWSTTRTCPRNS